MGILLNTCMFNVGKNYSYFKKNPVKTGISTNTELQLVQNITSVSVLEL